MNDFDPTRETPRLPVAPFIATDVVLVGIAGLIGWQAEAPLAVAPLAAISFLVGLGAIIGLYPFFQNHARRQEEAVQERANQIEALARTLGATAEQVSIAVANLPSIADSSARQLKLAEQLPVIVQKQIAALQQQLSATANEENAALRHELDTLRGAEADKLLKALADLGRLEALVARHATALDAAISHLPRLADNVGERTADAIRRETESSLKSLRGVVTEASIALASATNEARAAFESSARDAVAHLSTRAASMPPFQVIAPEPAKPARVEAPVVSEVEPVAEIVTKPEPEPIEPVAAPAPASVKNEPDLSVAPEPELAAESISISEAPELVAPTAAVAATVESESSARDAVLPAAPTSELIDDSGLDDPSVAAAPIEPTTSEVEAAPAPIAEPSPVSIDDAESEKSALETAAIEEAAEADAAPASDAEPVIAPDEDAPAEEAMATAALSHDGYTRLLVTAYIGIGNKLFIRGDGPGLRSDKGVALQFVSIGKWRWESAELLFPAKVRLYKNDQVECSALGELTLEPGHHHEVSAQF